MVGALLVASAVREAVLLAEGPLEEPESWSVGSEDTPPPLGEDGGVKGEADHETCLSPSADVPWLGLV